MICEIAGAIFYNPDSEAFILFCLPENPPLEFSSEFKKIFKTNKKAWLYYQSETPTYRKVTTRWVMSAKQDSTRTRRLKELIYDSAAGKKIKAMSYGKK